MRLIPSIRRRFKARRATGGHDERADEAIIVDESIPSRMGPVRTKIGKIIHEAKFRRRQKRDTDAPVPSIARPNSSSSSTESIPVTPRGRPSIEQESTATRTTPRELPIEIWEHIIDMLRYDLDALIACSEVGPTWKRRCRKHVQLERYTGQDMTFRHQDEVARIGKMTFKKLGTRFLHIRGGEDGERKPIPHFATWATMFAGRWNGVELSIENAEWRTQDMRLDTFRDLANFTWIGHLHLNNVTFPSNATFGRLLCALPSLHQLSCRGVRSSARGFDQAILPRHGKLTLGLKEIHLQDGISLIGVANFFAMSDFCTRLAKIRLTVGVQQHLTAEHFRPAKSLQCLLRDLHTSLTSLVLELRPDEYCLDLSHNTMLSDITVHIHVDCIDFQHCSLSQLFSQVAPDATIYSVNIHFHMQSAAFCSPNVITSVLTRLIEESCSSLDHIFSLPPFAGLQIIHLSFAVPQNVVNTAWTLLQKLAPYQLFEFSKQGLVRLELPFRDKYHFDKSWSLYIQVDPVTLEISHSKYYS